MNKNCPNSLSLIPFNNQPINLNRLLKRIEKLSSALNYPRISEPKMPSKMRVLMNLKSLIEKWKELGIMKELIRPISCFIN